MNLREKDRIAVNLPCSFQKAQRRFTGYVKNMSRIGLLTVWNEIESGSPEIKHGEIWEVEIELPVHHLFPPNAFYCQAVVVRMGKDRKNKREVAFRIDRMTAAALRSKAMSSLPVPHFVM